VLAQQVYSLGVVSGSLTVELASGFERKPDMRGSTNVIHGGCGEKTGTADGAGNTGCKGTAARSAAVNRPLDDHPNNVILADVYRKVLVHNTDTLASHYGGVVAVNGIEGAESIVENHKPASVAGQGISVEKVVSDVAGCYCVNKPVAVPLAGRWVDVLKHLNLTDKFGSSRWH